MSADKSEEASGRVLEATSSPFLAIPPELRLCIYEFALLDSTCVTIGHAEVVGKPADVVSRGTRTQDWARGRARAKHLQKEHEIDSD